MEANFSHKLVTTTFQVSHSLDLRGESEEHLVVIAVDLLASKKVRIQQMVAKPSQFSEGMYQTNSANNIEWKYKSSKTTNQNKFNFHRRFLLHLS